MSSLFSFTTSDIDPREIQFTATEYSESVQITRELIQDGTHYSDTCTIETATDLQEYSKSLARTHQTSLWTLLLYHTIRKSQFETTDIFYVGTIHPVDILLTLRHPDISAQSFNMLFKESQQAEIPLFQTQTKTHTTSGFTTVGISGLPDTNAIPTTIQYIIQVLRHHPDTTVLIPWDVRDTVTVSNFDLPIELETTAELNLPQYLLGLSTDFKTLSSLPRTPQIVYITGHSVFENFAEYIEQYINQTDSPTVVLLFDSMGSSNTFSQFTGVIRNANKNSQTGCILYSEFNDHLKENTEIQHKLFFPDNKPVQEITIPTITIPRLKPIEKSVTYTDIYTTDSYSTAQAITPYLNQTQVKIPILPLGHSTVLEYTPESNYTQIDFKTDRF